MVLTMAVAVIILIILTGIFSNSLTIVALLICSHQRKNVANVFIIALSIVNLLLCILVLPFNAITYYEGDWLFGDTVCKMVALMRYFIVECALLCITMITINRYILVAHYHLYPKIYKPVWVTAMIIFCLAFSFGKHVNTFFGLWGVYAYNSKIMSCTIIPDQHGTSPKKEIMVFECVIPCTAIIFCYFRIFWIISRSTNRMQIHEASNGTLPKTESPRSCQVLTTEKEWRLTMMILATFVAFLVCYIPITITVLVDKEGKYPGLHIWTTIALFMSASINPIIYALLNKQYRESYKRALCFYQRQNRSTLYELGS